MVHPFEVGEVYRNRDGRYEVLAIEELKMRIRHEEGHENGVIIINQGRIGLALRGRSSPLTPSGF